MTADTPADTLDQDRRRLVELTDDVLGTHCGLVHLRARLDEGTASRCGVG
jgi:hypothetical protein